ncbi:MAG: hypothetical protein ACI9QD_000717, partial [Thermoproteota archaeon]
QGLEKIKLTNLPSRQLQQEQKEITLSEIEYALAQKTIKVKLLENSTPLVSKELSINTFIRVAYNKDLKNVLFIDSTNKVLPIEFYDYLNELGGFEKTAIIDKAIYAQVIPEIKKVTNKNIFIINNFDLSTLLASKNNIISVNDVRDIDISELSQHKLNSLFDLNQDIYLSTPVLNKKHSQNLIIESSLNDLTKLEEINNKFKSSIHFLSKVNSITTNELLSNVEVNLEDVQIFKMYLDSDLGSLRRKLSSLRLNQIPSLTKSNLLFRMIELSKDKKALKGLAYFGTHIVKELKLLKKTAPKELRKYLKKAISSLAKATRRELKKKVRKQTLTHLRNYNY